MTACAECMTALNASRALFREGHTPSPELDEALAPARLALRDAQRSGTVVLLEGPVSIKTPCVAMVGSFVDLVSCAGGEFTESEFDAARRRAANHGEAFMKAASEVIDGTT
ncbi:hypothetical protein AB0M28_13585 [Streptomyces sp. NPDC051940]|uniref:hypothetical protein n=1 Tax=Streptomyces sp. NPDC051940 TaxID=3155675 RepID=UPI003423B81C